MIVIVVAACPIGLRGFLTRWLLEISPGVFVGKVSTRVRARLWQRVLDMAKTGRAILVYQTDNEQGLAFDVHQHEWVPIDHEGINLMLRPAARTPGKTGWSNASKRRRFAHRPPQ